MVELVYPPVILSALAAFQLGGMRFDVVGTENVPAKGGAVLASNHVSYLDFIFVGLAAHPAKRLVRFMAKDSVFRSKVSGPLMRGMKHIPVDRAAGAEAFDAAEKALKEGEIIGVFPEATISRSFEIKEFKTGAARLAAQADVPLIPMITWGGQRIYSKGTPRQLRRGHCIALTVGEPMYPTPADDPAVVTAELRSRMIELWEATLDRYPDQPSGDDDRWWLPASHGGTAPTPEVAQAEDEASAERRKSRAADRSPA